MRDRFTGSITDPCLSEERCRDNRVEHCCVAWSMAAYGGVGCGTFHADAAGTYCHEAEWIGLGSRKATEIIVSGPQLDG